MVESLGLYKKTFDIFGNILFKTGGCYQSCTWGVPYSGSGKNLNLSQNVSYKNHFSRWSTLKQPFLMWLLQYRALLVWRYQNNQYDSTKSLLLVLLLFLKIVFVHTILLIAGATKWSPAGRPCHWAESLCCSQWSSSQWTGSLSSS